MYSRNILLTATTGCTKTFEKTQNYRVSPPRNRNVKIDLEILVLRSRIPSFVVTAADENCVQWSWELQFQPENDERWGYANDLDMRSHRFFLSKQVLFLLSTYPKKFLPNQPHEIFFYCFMNLWTLWKLRSIYALWRLLPCWWELSTTVLSLQ